MAYITREGFFHFTHFQLRGFEVFIVLPLPFHWMACQLQRRQKESRIECPDWEIKLTIALEEGSPRCKIATHFSISHSTVSGHCHLSNWLADNQMHNQTWIHHIFTTAQIYPGHGCVAVDICSLIFHYWGWLKRLPHATSLVWSIYKYGMQIIRYFNLLNVRLCEISYLYISFWKLLNSWWIKNTCIYVEIKA